MDVLNRLFFDVPTLAAAPALVPLHSMGYLGGAGYGCVVGSAGEGERDARDSNMSTSL